MVAWPLLGRGRQWLLGLGLAVGAAAPGCRQYSCADVYRPENPCQCNEKCENFGSCCSDYRDVCAGASSSGQAEASSSCRGRCDKGYVAHAPCQCNDACSRYESCCSDYRAECEDHEDGSHGGQTGAAAASGPLPAYRDPASHTKILGISYGPSPEKKEGRLLPNDDFMSPMAALQWDNWGRGDLRTMASLGANHVRLYGNDPSQDHGPFLHRARQLGISAIVGLSDWPYLQMPGSCKETEYDCFKQIYESYKKNLENGFTIEGGTAYDPALKALIIVNEPELKFGSLGEAAPFCRSVVSATDAILQAEKDVGVKGRLIALTVTVSFAKPFGAPGLGQMKKFHECFMNPGGYPTKYQAKNDVKGAYLNRWVNSLNTFNSPGQIKQLLFDPYPHVFWTSELQIPVFIGEYHFLGESVHEDLPRMVSYTQSLPFFLGASFFEFSRRYDKTGKDRAKEMKYGMFGLDDHCVMGHMRFFCTWYTGKPETASYKVLALHELEDSDGGDSTIAAGVAHAYGGSVPRGLQKGACTGRHALHWPNGAYAAATQALLAAGCQGGGGGGSEVGEGGDIPRGRGGHGWLWVMVTLVLLLAASGGVLQALIYFGVLARDDVEQFAQGVSHRLALLSERLGLTALVERLALRERLQQLDLRGLARRLDVRGWRPRPTATAASSSESGGESAAE